MYSNRNTLTVHQDSPLTTGDRFEVKHPFNWWRGRRFHGLIIRSWNYNNFGGKELHFDYDEWWNNNPENPFKKENNPLLLKFFKSKKK